MPGFHEVRALSLHLHKKARKDGQKIASHVNEGMTKNYQRDHEGIVWSEAIPDLNISEITGSFARVLRRPKTSYDYISLHDHDRVVKQRFNPFIR